MWSEPSDGAEPVVADISKQTVPFDCTSVMGDDMCRVRNGLSAQVVFRGGRVERPNSGHTYVDNRT